MTWGQIKQIVQDMRREATESFITDEELLRYANLTIQDIGNSYPWHFAERIDGGIKIESQTVIGNISRNLPEDFKEVISVNGNLNTSAVSTPFEFDYIKTRDFNLLVTGYYWDIVGRDLKLFFPQGSIVATNSTTGDDQSQTTADSFAIVGADGGGNQTTQAQGFIPQKPFTRKIVLRKEANLGTPTGDISIKVVKSDESLSTPKPDLSTVYVDVTVPKATWDAVSNGSDIEVDLGANVELFFPRRYWIVISSTASEAAGNSYAIGYNSNGGYAQGNRASTIDNGVTWTDVPSEDLYFKTIFVERDLSLSYFSNYIVRDADGYQLKNNITKDGDTFLIPDRYQEVIIEGILRYVFRKEGKTDDHSYASERFNTFLQQMLLDEPSKGHQPLRQFRHYMNGF